MKVDYFTLSAFAVTKSARDENSLGSRFWRSGIIEPPELGMTVRKGGNESRTGKAGDTLPLMTL